MNKYTVPSSWLVTADTIKDHHNEYLVLFLLAASVCMLAANLR